MFSLESGRFSISARPFEPSPGAALLYLISDRRALGDDGASRLVALAADAARVGIDLLQIRENDLTTRRLTTLVSEVVEATGGRTRVLVNDRFDVALAAGADGVHLKTTSVDAHAVRKRVGSRLTIGVSTHGENEARKAVAGGADFVVCGPVFDTPSKRALGKPLGLERLAVVAARSGIPVLGLGGIDVTNSAAVLSCGAAGVAGIRVFQDAWLEGGAESLANVARMLRCR